MKKLFKAASACLSISLIFSVFSSALYAAPLVPSESNVIQVDAKDFEKYGIKVETTVNSAAERFDSNFIVKLKDSNSNIIKKIGGIVKRENKKGDIVVAELTKEAHSLLKQEPNVKYVEPNFQMKSFEAAADSPIVPYDIQNINAQDAHQQEATGKGIKVAVLDTGVTPTVDLTVAGGQSFVEGDTAYTDANGHGTHVAGIIAAESNRIGVLGVTPEVTIYSLKVLNSEGNGSYSSVIEALDWALDNKIQIINMSFGGTAHSKILEEKLEEVHNAGILVVASAGNSGSGSDTIQFPAQYPTVIAVGAVDQTNTRAPFSSEGPALDLVAPGVEITSTLSKQTYIAHSGTSMAAPHVTGAGAILLYKNKQLSVDELTGILFDSATPLGFREEYGHGLVNVKSALDMLDNYKNVKDGKGVANRNALKSKYTVDTIQSDVTIQATTQEGYYLDDGYDYVPNNYFYAWTIRPPAGTTKFRIYLSVDTEANYDFVKSSASSADKWSGIQTVWTSWAFGSPLVLSIETDSSVQSRGFQTYSIEYETSNVSNPTEYYFPYAIESPHEYPNNYDVTQTLSVPNATNIAVVFKIIDTEAGYDFVTTSAGDRWDGYKTDVLSSWSGTNQISVRLYSDGSVTKYGYRIERAFFVPTGGGSGTGKTYYSQTIPNWTTTNLDKLFFPNYLNDSKAARTPTVYNSGYTSIDSSAYDRGFMNMWGCWIASFAMVLKNMGATTSTQQDDLRTGSRGYLQSDPYTVMMANVNWSANTSSGGKYYNYFSGNDPMIVYPSRIANAFGKTSTSLISLSGTVDQKANTLAMAIRNNPEGVMVRFQKATNPNDQHTLVFVGTTLSGTSSLKIPRQELSEEELVKQQELQFKNPVIHNYDQEIKMTASVAYGDKFTVTDPASTTGNNVLFNECWTASYFGGLENAIGYMYLD